MFTHLVKLKRGIYKQKMAKRDIHVEGRILFALGPCVHGFKRQKESFSLFSVRQEICNTTLSIDFTWRKKSEYKIKFLVKTASFPEKTELNFNQVFKKEVSFLMSYVAESRRRSEFFTFI